MSNKKTLLAGGLLSIVTIASLVGQAAATGNSPWDQVWSAINDLRSKVSSLEDQESSSRPPAYAQVDLNGNVSNGQDIVAAKTPAGLYCLKTSFTPINVSATLADTYGLKGRIQARIRSAGADDGCDSVLPGSNIMVMVNITPPLYVGYGNDIGSADFFVSAF